MGKQLSALTPRLKAFITEQRIFFVATAMREGRINLSPKGMDALRILDEHSLVWLNVTGSGNETATHLRHDGRMTLMFAAFEGPPSIVRLYGNARAYHPRDDYWNTYIGLFPSLPGSRQLIHMEIELVQISCGMAVPLMEYKADRELLNTWAEEKGAAGLHEYRAAKNTISLDGHETGIFE
jgi:hypothetical protein